MVISSSSQSKVETAVSTLQSSYPSAKDRVKGYAYSMGDQSSLEKNIHSLLSDATSSGAHKLDHIVWSAGDPLATMPPTEYTLEKLQRAGLVRFFGPMLLGKYAKDFMNAGPQSSITFTGGSVGLKPHAGWAIPGSYVMAMHGLTRSFALDLKPLRCNLISMGMVDTDLWAGKTEEERNELKRTYEEKVPTGRVPVAEDVAEAYLYVMRDMNVTGEIIGTHSGDTLV